MLTLEQILRKSPKSWLANSDDVRIDAYKKIVDKEDKNPTVLAILYSVYDHEGNRKTNPVKHRCYIKGLNGKDKKIIESKVEVSCDCQAFKYWSEVALEHKDAAIILHSNGKAPVERNPAMIPFACKHVIRLGHLIQVRGL